MAVLMAKSPTLDADMVFWAGKEKLFLTAHFPNFHSLFKKTYIKTLLSQLLLAN